MNEKKNFWVKKLQDRKMWMNKPAANSKKDVWFVDESQMGKQLSTSYDIQR